MNDVSDEDDRADETRAARRWRAQFRTYCVVMVLLFVVNLTTSPGAWWMHWSALGWGMGLLFQWTKLTETAGRRRDHPRRADLPTRRREAPALDLAADEPPAPAGDALVRRAEALLERERRAR